MLLLFQCRFFAFVVDEAIVSSTDQYSAMEELYRLRYASMTLVDRLVVSLASVSCYNLENRMFGSGSEGHLCAT